MRNQSRKKTKKSSTYKKRIKHQKKTKKYIGGSGITKNYKNIIDKIRPDYTNDNKWFDIVLGLYSFIPLNLKFLNGVNHIKKSISLYGMYVDNFYRLGRFNVLNNVFPEKICSDLLSNYICNTKIKDLISSDSKKGDTLPEELRIVQTGGGSSCATKKFCHTHNNFNNLNVKGVTITNKILRLLESTKLYKTSDGHFKYMSLLHKYTISELASLLSVYMFVNTKYKTYYVQGKNSGCKTSDEIYTDSDKTEAPKEADFVNLIGPFKKVNDVTSIESENVQELLLLILNLFDSCINLNLKGKYPKNIKTEDDKHEFNSLCSIECENCTVYAQSKIQTPEKNSVDIILSKIFYIMYNYNNFKKYKLREDTIINNVYNMSPVNNFYNSKNERLKFNKSSIPLFIKELKIKFPDEGTGITENLQTRIKIYFDKIDLPLYVCKMILYKIYTKKPVELFA